jgi:hypothetical protein
MQVDPDELKSGLFALFEWKKPVNGIVSKDNVLESPVNRQIVYAAVNRHFTDILPFR